MEGLSEWGIILGTREIGKTFLPRREVSRTKFPDYYFDT